MPKSREEFKAWLDSRGMKKKYFLSIANVSISSFNIYLRSGRVHLHTRNRIEEAFQRLNRDVRASA